MKTKPLFHIISMIMLAALLGACASTSHILVGTARPPIDPSNVRVFASPPAFPFEEIAVMESSSDMTWTFTDQGKMNKVVEILKEQAASLGANGIILREIGSRRSSGVTITDTSNKNIGFGHSIDEMEKTGAAVAIYFNPEALVSTGSSK
jgi:hypothetical protein